MDWELRIGTCRDSIGCYSYAKILLVRFRHFRFGWMRKVPHVRIGNWRKMTSGAWKTFDSWTSDDYRDRPEDCVVNLLNHEHMHHVLFKLEGTFACYQLDQAIRFFEHESVLGIPDFYFESELESACPDYAGDFRVVDDVRRDSDEASPETFIFRETQVNSVEASE